MVSSKAPILRLFCGHLRVVTVSASGHIHVLSTASGDVICSTVGNEEHEEKILKSGFPLAATVDNLYLRLVVVSSDKTVRVWNLHDLSVVSEREVSKKPTDVCLSSDGQTILVSDKFGDVHVYSSNTPSQTIEASTSSNANGEKKPKRVEDDTLLLGHVSLLTTLLLTKDEKYIITADRDEHIRVSWYPEAYCVERYCLGHKKFVSALHIPPSNLSLLISGGGDPELRVWDWMEGKTFFHIPVADSIVPHIKVKRQRAKDVGEDGDGENGEQRMSSRKRRRQTKKTKKENGALEGSPVAVTDEVAGDESEMVGDDGGQDDALDGENDSEIAPIIAIQKILTVSVDSSEYIIFSAHGTAALFFCSFPTASCPSPSVHVVPLSKPVLDFTLMPEKNEVWVAMDVTWSGDAAHPSDDGRAVHCLSLSEGTLCSIDEPSCTALLSTINSTVCSQTPPSPETDLYSALVVLPKMSSAEHETLDETDAGESLEKQLTGKQKGRMKAKKAVAAKKEGLVVSYDVNRDVKRARSDTDAE